MKTDYDWRVESLHLHYQTHGSNKGDYTGCIEFVNGHNEGFTVAIPADKGYKYLALLTNEIVQSATERGTRLAEQLKEYDHAAK